MKPKVLWRLQEAGAVRNVEHLPRKVKALRRASLRGRPCAAPGQATGMGLPEPFTACISPQLAQDAGHAATEFNICPAGFRSLFWSDSLLFSHSSLLE